MIMLYSVSPKSDIFLTDFLKSIFNLHPKVHLTYNLEILQDLLYTAANLHVQNVVKTKFIMKCREALLINVAAAFPFLGIQRSTAFHFVIGYTVLIKTLRLSPHTGVSLVEGVSSLHVVMRQAGTY